LNFRLILFFILISLAGYGQKYTILKGDFSIIEKKENGKENTITIGFVEYDSKLKSADFSIRFPQVETWHLRDSMLYKYKNDSLILTKVVGEIGDNFMFNDILNFDGSDFGLEKVGFTTRDVVEKDGLLTIYWDPPEVARTFLKEAITQIEENLLVSAVFIDVDDVTINETYYEKYEIVKGLPIPVHITSKFQSKNEALYKVVKMNNVDVE
jgi:hypothetical protein